MTEIQQLEETIYRLRRLHGVLDAALILAAEALHESVGGGLLVGEWHDTLIANAQKEMMEHGVFEGRWSLFSVAELETLYQETCGSDDESAKEITREVHAEIVRRSVAMPEVNDGRDVPDSGRSSARDPEVDVGGHGERDVEDAAEDG